MKTTTKFTCLLLVISSLCINVALAATASDANRYDSIPVNDSYTYKFDLGDIDETATSMLDIRLGYWFGPNSSDDMDPEVSGELLVNGALVGTWDIFEAWFNTTNPSDIFNTTGFLQDGMNSFEFNPTAFISPDSEWAVGSFELNYDLPPIPIPAAVWLFGSALLGFVGVAKRNHT